MSSATKTKIPPMMAARLVATAPIMPALSVLSTSANSLTGCRPPLMIHSLR